MRWLFMVLVLVVFLAGCAQQGSEDNTTSEPKLCAADVLECPDGSFVARDPYADCAFEPCPAPSETTQK